MAHVYSDSEAVGTPAVKLSVKQGLHHIGIDQNTVEKNKQTNKKPQKTEQTPLSGRFMLL